LFSESELIVERFAEYLKQHPTMKIEVSGHTDNVGNVKDNEALSTNRAFSVKALLEEMGVEGGRIRARGYGSARPRADNNTEEGRAMNRRTEFEILKS